MDTIEDTSAPDPSRAFDIQAVKELLADAIKRLPEREKIVIGLYYYEGLTLKEIGEVLGVTESRISQLHTKAILRLKGRIKEELEPGLLAAVAAVARAASADARAVVADARASPGRVPSEPRAVTSLCYTTPVRPSTPGAESRGGAGLNAGSVGVPREHTQPAGRSTTCLLHP